MKKLNLFSVKFDQIPANEPESGVSSEIRDRIHIVASDMLEAMNIVEEKFVGRSISSYKDREPGDYGNYIKSVKFLSCELIAKIDYFGKMD